MKKVLVLGIKGMAGHLIYNYFKLNNNYKAYGIARNINTQDSIFNLDITNTTKLKTIIDKNNFDVIINCIGILNKVAEDNPSNAVWYNSYLPHLIEDFTKNTKTKFIHISTDCVFSGEKGNYTETDIKDGVGFYSESKSLGEVINKKDATIRTSIIGPELNLNGIGLLNWFLKQPKTNTLNGYTQVFWTGLTTLELAKSIEQVIEQKIIGLIQIVPEEKISKYNLISLFNKSFRDSTLNIVKHNDYKIDKSLKSNRKDFNYKVPNYLEMIEAQKRWMIQNRNLYKHYNF